MDLQTFTMFFAAKPPQMMKGIPQPTLPKDSKPVMHHHSKSASSAVQGGKLLQTPSGQQVLGHRWAAKFIQKNEGKSLAFTIFCDLRRGSEGLHCNWGYLCCQPSLLAEMEVHGYLANDALV